MVNGLKILQPKAVFILLGLATLLYLPFIAPGFLTDDFAHLWHLHKGACLLTGPDAFGFFRPLTALTLYLNYQIFQMDSFPYGLTNLFFHLVSIFFLFKAVCLYWGDDRVAFFTLLVFIFTLKAHPMAVIWISGRSELLMTCFFSLAWFNWLLAEERHSQVRYYLSFLFYLLALLSKENAALIPLIFIVMSGKRSGIKKKWFSSLMFLIILLLVIGLRYIAGALMPFSSNVHYNLAVPVGIVGNNLSNYFFRSLPGAGLFVLFLIGPLMIFAIRETKSSLLPFIKNGNLRSATLALIWFLVFILPVSAIRMRSELYLYLAGFGICLFVSFLMVKVIIRLPWSNPKIRMIFYVGLSIYIALSSGYIINRNLHIRQAATFSRVLLGNLKEIVPVSRTDSFIYLIPDDTKTERLLRESIHGYFDIVVKLLYNRMDIGGRISYEGDYNAISFKIPVRVLYQNGKIRLTT